MKKPEDPPVWVTTLKLLVGATALIGSVGFALWYVAEQQSDGVPTGGDKDWGIVTDSPIRSKR